MDILMIFHNFITTFGNLLNTIIQLSSFLTGYGIMVDSWTFLVINGTSLLSIFGLNPMGLG